MPIIYDPNKPEDETNRLPKAQAARRPSSDGSRRHCPQPRLRRRTWRRRGARPAGRHCGGRHDRPELGRPADLGRDAGAADGPDQGPGGLAAGGRGAGRIGGDGPRRDQPRRAGPAVQSRRRPWARRPGPSASSSAAWWSRGPGLTGPPGGADRLWPNTPCGMAWCRARCRKPPAKSPGRSRRSGRRRPGSRAASSGAEPRRSPSRASRGRWTFPAWRRRSPDRRRPRSAGPFKMSVALLGPSRRWRRWVPRPGPSTSGPGCGARPRRCTRRPVRSSRRSGTF